MTAAASIMLNKELIVAKFSTILIEACNIKLANGRSRVKLLFGKKI